MEVFPKKKSWMLFLMSPLRNFGWRLSKNSVRISVQINIRISAAFHVRFSKQIFWEMLEEWLVEFPKKFLKKVYKLKKFSQKIYGRVPCEIRGRFSARIHRIVGGTYEWIFELGANITDTFVHCESAKVRGTKTNI